MSRNIFDRIFDVISQDCFHNEEIQVKESENIFGW